MRYADFSEPEYSLLSGEETIRLINNTDPDLWTNKRIRYLVSNEARQEKHIIAKVGDKIVGMAGIQHNPYNGNDLWIKFISVDPEYQGNGIARELLRKIYLYALENNVRFAPGSFTEEGDRLRHIHDEFDKIYPAATYRKINGNYVDDEGKIIR